MSESQSGYLSPDQITSASFETKRRGGVDPDAVSRHLSSVAATVHGLTAERDTLQAQVDSLREQLDAVPAAAPAAEELDEAELTERLGQDAARVLSEARAAAADRLAEAEDEAAGILAAAEEIHAARSAEADLEAQRIRAGAETVVEERQAEAERAAAEIMASAEAEAANVRTAGSTDRESADADAARIIREAELTRRQILEDLARRRSSARRQIEQLRAGRERLLASHETVRRALDEISDELTISMSEARAAAETAGHSVSDTTIEELEAEIETARLTGLLDTGPLPVVERAPAKKKSPSTKPSPVSAVPQSTPSSEVPMTAPTAVEESDETEATSPTAEPDPTPEAAPASSTTEESVVVDEEPVVDSADTDTGTDTANEGTESAAADLAPVVQLDRARNEVDTATHPATGREAGNGRSSKPPTAKPDPAPAAKVTKLESVKSTAPTESSSDASAASATDTPDVIDTIGTEEDDSVGDLFASLRSETPKPKAAQKAPTAKKSTAKKTKKKESASAAAPVEVDSSEMTRRLKRVLADEQSRAMSKVKSAEQLPDLADLLGSEDEHTDTYWVEVLGQLDDVSAGTDEVQAPVRSLVEDIRRRVGTALDGADGDSESAVNALRSVYRELKTQKITPCADAVCRTAGVGVGS